MAITRRSEQLAAPRLGSRVQPFVVTGGSGFIGSNLANSLLADGRDVVIIDSLVRGGVAQNLDWLKHRHKEKVIALIADILDMSAIEGAFEDAAAVFHLAAQTAVTTSLERPTSDFEVNARGTINILEAVRRSRSKPPLIFSSTNKVYGGLQNLRLMEVGDRHVPEDSVVCANGISERQGLSFCTPYGCSKGVADQYVLDYANSYGIPTAVLRMSCVYGQRQFGTEDQGWVAHFLIEALKGRPLTIYGDGKQVRDILHVDDAVRAYRALLNVVGQHAGKAFNLGGGPHNAVSLLMVLREIERLIGRKIVTNTGDWRQGDQLYFVADSRALTSATGWKATIPWRDGIRRLANWLLDDRRSLAPDQAARKWLSA